METRRSLRTRFRERQYRPATVRVGLGSAVAVAVCLWQFGSTSGADTSFVPGTSNAGAQTIEFAPTVAGLPAAITLAISIANYQNSIAQALSQTIDLGAIGTVLEAPGCDGGAPTLPKKDVPPGAQAESTDGNQSLTQAITAATTPLGLGVGSEHASATTAPAGTATTSVANYTVAGGLLTIAGATSTATAAIVNGNTRTASATSDIASISIDKGLIVLGPLHWAASQSSGGSTSSTATFSLGSLKLAGVTVPISANSPQAILNIINTALAPVGINFQWPSESTATDGTVSISPLLLGIDGNELGQQIIGANLGKAQTVRSALVSALSGINCNFNTIVGLSDIAIGPLAGGGNVNIELGGAHALTTDAATVSPFGSGDATGGSSTDTSGLDTGSSTLPDSFGLPGGDTSGTGGPTTTPTTGAPRQSLGPTQKTTNCISLGPAGGGCNGHNAALPIGLIGLGVVIALAIGDYIRQRRRLRMAGQEI